MRYPVLDPALLPRITLVDVPDEEVILRARMLRFKQLWAERDPPFGAVYDVDGLEFDPIKICQEASTSFHANLLAGINAWGEATSLARAWATNLDNIASRYPGGVPRLPVVASPRPYSVAPADWEGDERYRKRIWLSANAFSSAGAEDAYVFWAMTLFPQARDVTATMQRVTRDDYPSVVVTVLKEGADPRPTAAELLALHEQLHRPEIKPLTDVVTVSGPAVIDVPYEVDVYLYPGADSSLIMPQVDAALAKLADDKYYLGEDQTEFDIHAAAKVVGVQNAIVKSPAADMPINKRQVAKVSSIKANLKGRRE